MAQNSDDPSLNEEKPRNEDESASEPNDDEILERARAFFKASGDAWHDIRRKALEDIKFSIGEQWDPAIKASREVDARPCLVINRIPQFIQQVTNDQRQNRPAIKVHPVDDDADVETAKVKQGLFRHIEYASSADAAYDTAFEAAVRGSFGFWRLVPEYLDPTSFDQDIVIKRIPNQFSVFFDPHSVEPDGSDQSEGGITEDLSKEEYKRRHPNSKLSQAGEWDTVGNQYPDWMPSGLARVAEYFYKEWRSETLVQLKTGEVFFEKDIAKFEQPLPPEAIKGKRKTQIPQICWIKMNATEILDRSVLPGSGRWIPIVPVFGNDLIVDGKRVIEGLTRHAKDPQRMLNYWKSAETEAIALAPKAPFIIAEGQIEGYEQIWQTANKANHSYLPYKMTDHKGQLAPPPQRQSFEPAVQAITQAAMMATDDLKAVTGIYDSSLGAQANETSGVAIQRRNNQSQTSNFHLIDNLTRSIKHTGKIALDWMPDIYDSARSARIVGEDGTQKVVQVNQPHQDESGETVMYDMQAGKYDVTIDVGPSFASKRQESAAAMLDLARSVPQLGQAAPDLIVKMMDFPMSQEVADRLKKTLAPGLADDPKNQQVPPQVQAKLQQYGQLIDQLTKEAHAQSQIIETKKMELESRERIEMSKIRSNEVIASAELGSTESIALLKAEMAGIKHRLELLDYSQPFDTTSGPSAAGAQALGQPQGQPPIGGESPSMPSAPAPGQSMDQNP